MSKSLILVFAASCAVSPYSGQSVAKNTISVSGFTNTPNAQVRIEGYVWQDNLFFNVGTTRTSATSAFPAGAICPNSPALYSYKASVSLTWWGHWQRVDGRYQTKVRATELTAGVTPLMFTDNPNGVECMTQNAFNGTCDFYDVAYNVCGYRLTEAIVRSDSSAPGA